MRFWNWLTRRRTDHGWPAYIINGRIRTSTAGLIVAFFAISWLHNAYQPPAPVPAAPETAQVVPPGFMPDPEYTWVPRTNVQERPTTTTPTTTTTTTPTTTEPGQTDTTSPTSPTASTGPAPTTVVDPDGNGPLPATTMYPTTTTTAILPGQAATLPGSTPTPTPPAPLAPPR
jgi:cytoskeletal protein RodZ